MSDRIIGLGHWVVYVAKAPQGRRAYIPAEIIGFEDGERRQLLRLRLWPTDDGGSDWVLTARYDPQKTPNSWHHEADESWHHQDIDEEESRG